MISPLGPGLTPSIPGSAVAESASARLPASQVSDSAGFGNMMSAILKDTVTTLQTGEATAIAGMQKKVPLQRVVEAMMQAEQSLHTAVVVRDKVVGAYLEISRMQI